jgi:hypothetical protein
LRQQESTYIILLLRIFVGRFLNMKGDEIYSDN